MARQQRIADSRPAPDLTPRHWQVLKLLGVGFTDKEAAKRLGIAAKTLRHHREQILHRTGVANAAELAARWYALQTASGQPHATPKHPARWHERRHR